MESTIKEPEPTSTSSTQEPLISENLKSPENIANQLHSMAPTMPQEDPTYHKAIVWFENVFPFRIPLIDPRTPLIKRYAAAFVENKSYTRFIPEKFPSGSDFKITAVDHNLKEGGMYVEFKYKGGTIEEAIDTIRHHLVENNVRSYFNLQKINAFQVKGRPWVEDLVSRVPSRRLHVEFIKGPDLTVEALFREFRVFGRIMDIKLQKSTDKEVPRYASVQFVRKRAATSARNCIHGELFGETTIAIGYEENQGWWYKAWSWVNSNMRISVFLIVGALAGISYVVFDPWRRFSIKNHITGRYSLMQYTKSASKWWHVLTNTLKNSFSRPKDQSTNEDMKSNQWSERRTQTQSLQAVFHQQPESIIVISGPKGSGKSAFILDALSNQKSQLVVRCDELVGKGDYQALSNLSGQFNFFPTFGFVSQLSGFIDTVITATTGAKANLTTTTDGECRKILDCATLALQDITEKQIQERTKLLKSAAESESQVSIPEVTYPIIVIEDFLSKENVKEQYIYDLLTQWAAQLCEYRLAHVIFVSDKPNVAQVIGKWLPTKSLEIIHLSDATPKASLGYVKTRLGSNYNINSTFETYLKGLGGRLHDLDLFVSKIQAGLSPAAAFADITHRAIAELRKLGFDKKDGGWAAEEFWKVVTVLANKSEVQIDELCTHPIFNNDPSPILQMERAGILMIMHKNERPYSVKPSRPIFATAFKEMIQDTKLGQFMGILTCKKLIADCTKKIRDYEEELDLLNRNKNEHHSDWFSADPLALRKYYLTSQIGANNDKVQGYEVQSSAYKKALKLSEK